MAKSRRLVYSIIIIFIIAITILVIQSNVVETKETNNGVDLLFGKNFISYVIEEGKSMDFNLLGVQDLKTNKTSIEKIIENIKFNNPNVEILDYQLSIGNQYQHYQLFNIIFTVKVLTENVESAEKLTVQFKDGSEEVYDFGHLSIVTDSNYHKEHLEPYAEYNVGYPQLELNVNIRSTSQEDVQLLKINNLAEEISYSFNKPLVLSHQDVKRIKIDNFNINELENYDFITLTPILSYSINGQNYQYNMPGVVYGMFSADEELIQKIIKQ